MKNCLDSIDLTILKILQEKGRITNLQLSQKIGLSPAPTLERVKKLENSNIIKGYYAKINPQALGIDIQAFIMISLTRQIDNAIKNFTKQINKIDEIVECYQITGNFDYILKIIVKDIRSFEQLIANKLSKIDEIRQMQTMIVLSTVKESSIIPYDYN